MFHGAPSVITDSTGVTQGGHNKSDRGVLFITCSQRFKSDPLQLLETVCIHLMCRINKEHYILMTLNHKRIAYCFIK